MLDAVMLVLREVLEAAVFVSLLLALGAHLGVRPRWAIAALPLGLCASWGLSLAAYPLAEAFDGAGQELMNAALYALAIVGFTGVAALSVRHLRNAALPPARARAFGVLFALIVACSMAREGAEVWIYLSGFTGGSSALSSAVVGGLVGIGIGLSLSVLVYYGFRLLPRPRFLLAFQCIAALVVGGLSMQLAKQALQAGWLDAGESIWDSSWLVGEGTWLGQFLHAVVGYDANPDPVQVMFYLGALTLFGGCVMLQATRRTTHA